MLQNECMKTKLFLISGWAFGRSALRGLADQLEPDFEVSRLAAEDVLLPGQMSQMLAASQAADQPCVLAGWSLGGMLALEAASALAPGSMLVLIGSTAKFSASDDTPHGVPAAQLRSLSIALKRHPQKTITNFYNQSALPHAAIDQDTSDLGDNQGLLDGLSYLRDRDLCDTAASLHVPTLILHGGEDHVISPAASEDLWRRLGNSKWVTRDHVGHDLPIREPGWVVSNILDFWKTEVARCHAG